MKMNDTVARIVEIMFQDVEKNEETDAIREEVMNNCQERYADLTASGMAEDDAIAAVIESLKGMEDLLAPYKHRVHAPGVDVEVEPGECHAAFAAHENISRIDLSLACEDVMIDPSDDDAFHVFWNEDETPSLQAFVEEGVLIVKHDAANDAGRQTGNDEKKRRRDPAADFVKTENGKIEINMNSIEGMLKSVSESLKNAFSKNRINIQMSFSKGGVTVQVPESVRPHARILTTSGDIDVQDVDLADLNITSTSGDVNILLEEDHPLQLAEIRTTSGDIDATMFTQMACVSSTSGDVQVEGRIASLTASTISGDIDVRADVASMTFKAISGDVDLTFDSKEIREVRGSTISGDIGIDLPDDLGVMAIQARTRSGDVTTRYRANGVGPTVTGEVTSMSGDITIR